MRGIGLGLAFDRLGPQMEPAGHLRFACRTDRVEFASMKGEGLLTLVGKRLGKMRASGDCLPCERNYG